MPIYTHLQPPQNQIPSPNTLIPYIIPLYPTFSHQFQAAPTQLAVSPPNMIPGYYKNWEIGSIRLFAIPL